MEGGDFDQCRRAQEKLLSYGPAVLPAIRRAYEQAPPTDVKSLLLNLVGKLSVNDYVEIVRNELASPRKRPGDMACALKYIPATRLLQADAGQIERLRAVAISLTGAGGGLSDEDVVALKKFLRLTRRGGIGDE